MLDLSALGAEILTKTIDHEEHERQRAIEDAIENTRLAGEEAKIIALEKLSRKCSKVLTPDAALFLLLWVYFVITRFIYLSSWQNNRKLVEFGV